MPPAGPVAPSDSPPGEIEPRTNVNALPGDATATHVISTSGSYFLTGNISIATGVAIRIDVPAVYLDLNGFQISSAGSSCVEATAGLAVIENGRVGAFTSTINIVNGVVRNVISNATVPGEFVAVDSLVEGCRFDGGSFTRCIIENAQSAVSCDATESALRSCRLRNATIVRTIAESCLFASVDAVDSTLRDCQSFSSSSPTAAFMLRRSAAESCVARDAVGFGFDLDEGSVAETCIAGSCGLSGFLVERSAVSACIAIDNTDFGFIIDSGAAAGCRAEGHSTSVGFECLNASSLTECVATDNLGGFGLTGRSVAKACVATGNTALGFFVNDGSVVQQCVAADNGNSGIQLGINSRALGCWSSSNGNTGFVVGGATTGVEILECSAVANASQGFRQESPSLIAKNRATGNAVNYLLGMPGATPVVSPGAGVGAWDNIEY
ncbi:MAG: hypothetical protein AAGK04_02360 [Planctomycetota bacterium]